jgi:transcriptional regulator with XRE-family HTH domain
MDFRNWLQAEMDAREISPSALARKSKVPQPTIFRILSGETKDPRTGTVKKLEHALGAVSPPLDSPAVEHVEHNELLAAWDWLLPGERQELLMRIKAAAAHNRAATDHFKPKVIKVIERRKRTVHFDWDDRRQQKEDSDA